MTANVENARLLPYAVIQKAADGNVDSFHRTGFGKSTIGLRPSPSGNAAAASAW